jgi:hypothetical protein
MINGGPLSLTKVREWVSWYLGVRVVGVNGPADGFLVLIGVNRQ